MAICVDCGLTVDQDGTLRVAARDDGDWPFAECDITTGTPIYCGDDGQLYGPPEHSQVSGFSGGETVSGEFIVPPEGEFCGPAATVTITNPYCRDLNLHLQFGTDVRVVLEPGAHGLIGYKRDLDGGGLSNFIRILSPQTPNNTDANVGVLTSKERDFFNFVVPAGATRTIVNQTCFQNASPSGLLAPPTGNAIVEFVGSSVRFWGGTTAMTGTNPDGIIA